jgi:hypothetical protein
MKEELDAARVQRRIQSFDEAVAVYHDGSASYHCESSDHVIRDWTNHIRHSKFELPKAPARFTRRVTITGAVFGGVRSLCIGE